MSTSTSSPRGMSPMLLGRVVVRNRITPVYQPIVHLASGTVAAVEALSRPEEEGASGSIDDYFRTAMETGTIHDFDWQCRRCAIVGAAELPATMPLCIKLELAGVRELVADIDRMRCIAESVGRSVNGIVLEVTAAEALDSQLLPMLAAYRDAGFHLAVDRVTGAATARAVASLVNPEIIKLDRSLTSRLGDDEGRQAITAVVDVVRHATLVAQGIETAGHASDYSAVGIEFGEGYWLGRPGKLSALTPVEMSPAI